MEQVTITPLKQVHHPKGNVYHALKASERSFQGFGEAYFSSVEYGEVKGWKKHKQMVLNIVVPVGCIEFVIYDDRPESPKFGTFHSIILSLENYARLTVPSGVWMAFRGLDQHQNILLNLASIEHDPKESVGVELDEIEYDWRF